MFLTVPAKQAAEDQAGGLPRQIGGGVRDAGRKGERDFICHHAARGADIGRHQPRRGEGDACRAIKPLQSDALSSHPAVKGVGQPRD